MTLGQPVEVRGRGGPYKKVNSDKTGFIRVFSCLADSLKGVSVKYLKDC